ncbi:MAG: trans-sulfuration enzyme family protein [Oligoflexus sp.]
MASDEANFSPKSLSITLPPPDNQPVCQPVFHSVKYTMPSMEELRRLFRGERQGYFYSRYSNPTVEQLEKTLAAWQGCEAGIAVASGVAAIATVLLSQLSQGAHIVYFIESYRPTRLFIESILHRYGVSSSRISIHDHDAIRQAFCPETKLVIFESPTNPQLKAAPIDLITSTAKKFGSLVVMDNTFAGFHNHHRDDIDLYLHSLTKYACGHSDALGGAILGRKGLIALIRETEILTGPSLDPQAAYLILRGLKTYRLRYEKACQTALEVARWLETQDKVEQVFYPGLPSHPDYQRFLGQQKDFGGVLMFNLKNKSCSIDKILDHCQRFHVLASLGSVESLIAPVLYFYGGDLNPEERQRACIDHTSLRLAIGLDEPEVLMSELKELLDRFA